MVGNECSAPVPTEVSDELCSHSSVSLPPVHIKNTHGFRCKWEGRVWDSAEHDLHNIVINHLEG